MKQIHFVSCTLGVCCVLGMLRFQEFVQLHGSIRETNLLFVDLDELQHSDSSSDDGLWIYGASWAEGLSSWRYSLAEVMILAKKLNATIVEPGIRNGRLDRPGAGSISLFELFDRAQIEKFHSKWATSEQYWREQKASKDTETFHYCMSVERHKEQTCPNGQYFNQTELTYSTALESALKEKSTHPSKLVTLKMHRVWKNSFYDLRLQQEQEVPLVSWREVKSIVHQGLRFTRSLYEIADKTMALMNISRGQEFAVVHWRAELDKLDYIRCADDIVKVKKAMAMPTDTPFILMSSLSLNESNTWGGARDKARNSTAQIALQTLLSQHAFRMSDSTLPIQKDLIIYAAVDLILAQQAASFSTCSQHCRSPYDSCQTCNHKGNFANMALEFRWNNGRKQSWPCWPHNSSEWKKISQLW